MNEPTSEERVRPPADLRATINRAAAGVEGLQRFALGLVDEIEILRTERAPQHLLAAAIAGHQHGANCRCLKIDRMPAIEPAPRHMHPCNACGPADEFGADCRRCGHLVVLHSHSRPCVACAWEAELDNLRRQAAESHDCLQAIRDAAARLARR